MDELLTEEALGFDEDGQVFAKTGEVYAVYLPKANPTGSLDLSDTAATFTLRWYNPRNGEFANASETVRGGGKVPLGTPPRDADQDWVILLKVVSDK